MGHVPTFQYLVHNPLSRAALAPHLQVREPRWTEIVRGVGQFTGKIVLPAKQSSRDLLRAALEPDDGALYVKADNGSFPFGGPIIAQDWDWETLTVAITAVSWKSWLYGVFLGPLADLSADVFYSWSNVDQLQIAQEIVTLAVAGGPADGRPEITIGTELSGKLRDLSGKGLDFKYAAEYIDSMARRSGGFEWDLVPYADNLDGMPRLRFITGYPEIGGLIPDLLLRRTPKGGNMRVSGTITRSSADRRTRVWATGKPETSPFAADSDPALPDGNTLLREKVSNYSTVTERDTLASHARAERSYLSARLNMLRVLVPENAADLTAYPAGHRVRLQYEDAWYDIDLPAARIVERVVTPAGGAGTVEMLVDLIDAELPEVDTGGSV